tara:strand:- start:1913 stop:2167 length:255 start_codon:yes stop_codon:yes gene_type:complete
MVTYNDELVAHLVAERNAVNTSINRINELLRNKDKFTKAAVAAEIAAVKAAYADCDTVQAWEATDAPIAPDVVEDEITLEVEPA